MTFPVHHERHGRPFAPSTPRASRSTRRARTRTRTITPDAASGNHDPLFVNPAAGDYHLQAGSPAVDAGETAVASGESTHRSGRQPARDRRAQRRRADDGRRRLRVPAARADRHRAGGGRARSRIGHQTRSRPPAATPRPATRSRSCGRSTTARPPPARWSPTSSRQRGCTRARSPSPTSTGSPRPPRRPSPSPRRSDPKPTLTKLKIEPRRRATAARRRSRSSTPGRDGRVHGPAVQAASPVRPAGAFQHRSVAGANRLDYRPPPVPGRYRIVAIPRDGAGRAPAAAGSRSGAEQPLVRAVTARDPRRRAAPSCARARRCSRRARRPSAAPGGRGR